MGKKASAANRRPRVGFTGCAELTAVGHLDHRGALATQACATFTAYNVLQSQLSSLSPIEACGELTLDNYEEMALAMKGCLRSVKFSDPTTEYSYLVDNTGSSCCGDTATGAPVTPSAVYEHIQATPEQIWTVTHGLGRRPTDITIYVDNEETDGEIIHVDGNTMRICFVIPVSGIAYIA